MNAAALEVRVADLEQAVERLDQNMRDLARLWQIVQHAAGEPDEIPRRRDRHLRVVE